ncbi:hypothetical protein SAMN05216499_1607 [Actinacidiphila paucisporea]|uniref:Uncharacterized protein n=1 Tax=Actinacidiphila paucisporea TaxID=310782 RepID=A0A1M7R0I8_9ACTN|nr:hypothetical protein SAMN05216499_1607 [Actinacidiphila paucisporea]
MRHAKKAATNWIQQSRDAAGKGAHGKHLVYAADGKPVADDPWRHGKEGRTCTASTYGRACVTRHVASYNAVQLLASVAVTRAFGVRVPARALLAGAAINGLTHAVLDRREPLLWLAARAGKAGRWSPASTSRSSCAPSRIPAGPVQSSWQAVAGGPGDRRGAMRPVGFRRRRRRRPGGPGRRPGPEVRHRPGVTGLAGGAPTMDRRTRTGGAEGEAEDAPICSGALVSSWRSTAPNVRAARSVRRVRVRERGQTAVCPVEACYVVARAAVTWESRTS